MAYVLIFLSGIVGLIIAGKFGVESSPFVAMWLGFLGVAFGGRSIFKRQSETHEKLDKNADRLENLLNGALEQKMRRVVGHEFMRFSEKFSTDIKQEVESAVDSALDRRLGQ